MILKQKDGRVFSLFCTEYNDPAEAEALISQNLVCQLTGIVYKVEEFRSPLSVRQCFNCESLGHSAKNWRSNQKCLIWGKYHSHKGCLEKEARKPVRTARDHVLYHTKRVRNTKNRHLGNMWSITKKTYASTVCRNTLPQPKTSNEKISRG